MSQVMADTPGERLRELREAQQKKTRRKVTQRDVASYLGLNEHTYRSYEYDKANFPEELARKLGIYYNLDWQTIYEPDRNTVGIPLVPAPQLLVPVTFIGSVSASSKFDWNDPFESEELIEVPPEMGGRDTFACRAKGDSMYDLIWPEDICVYRKNDAPPIGLVVCYRSKDRKVTQKQLKHNGLNYILHPLNSRYEDEIADGSAFGYLVGIIREIGTRRVTVYDPHGIRP